MSTHIETILGEKEIELGGEWEKTSMSLTRFWGGAKKGRMLQFTISNGEGYIQLTKHQVIELSKILLNSFDDEKYPSE